MTYNPYANYTYPMYNAQQTAVPTQTQSGIIWVDGEVGAKAQQLPQGWPANTPIPLWDTNDTVIYLKSVNPMGMPNPLQRLHYTMDDQPAPARTGMPSTPLLASGTHETTTEHQYVTKDDLEQMKAEIRESITEAMTTMQTAKKGGVKNEPAV